VEPAAAAAKLRATVAPPPLALILPLESGIPRGDDTEMRSLALLVYLVGACAAGAVDPRDPGTAGETEIAPQGQLRELEQLANAHRAQVGCGPLRWDARTGGVAQAHADDMVRRDYFNHTNPDGQSPFERLRGAGVTYSSAAENIAFGYPTATGVLQGWLNSEGHRRNLENCRYTHHGAGLNSGKWVHVFIGR
jgi:uncharacterized protein YkwD